VRAFSYRSFVAGVALVDAIGRPANAANHHPDVDLWYDGVTVRLAADDIGGLSERMSPCGRPHVATDTLCGQVCRVRVRPLDCVDLRRQRRCRGAPLGDA
jgi:hypothetical protein